MPIDLDALLRAQRALLAPDVPAGGAAWLEGATEAVRGLLGCDHTLFLFPEAEAVESSEDADDDATGSVLLRGRTLDTDPSVPRAFEDAFEGTWGSRTNWTDDLLTTSWSVRRRGGAGAYHECDLTPRSVVEGSEFYQEALRPHGLRHTMGIGVPLPNGMEYTLATYFGRSSAPGFSEGGLVALRLLTPAFEAAARAHARLIAAMRARRGTLVCMIDAFPPAALFAPEGRLVHRNPALTRLLDAEPGAGRRLRWTLRAWGRYLTRFEGTPTRGRETVQPPPGRVLSERGPLRLYGIPVGPELTGGKLGRASALVFVEPEGVRLPGADELCRRYGLTPREAEVARQLARGRRDREIAERLCIAHATARRHAERVLAKLGLSSRAGVALVLLNGRSENGGHTG